MQNNILFISHSACRTGAPLMLLNLLRWFKKNSNLSFEILLRGPGPLQEEFSAIAPTYFYENRITSGRGRACVSRIPGLSHFLAAWHHRQLVKRFRDSGVKLIYSNTITNGDILKTLTPLGCPVLTHVHELDYWIERSGSTNLDQVRRYSTHYIAASEAVKKNLVGKYSIASGKIDVMHSFIHACGITADPTGIRQKLGIPESAFVVLGSGQETWRKGKDLFVRLAALVSKSVVDRPVHFLWVGGWENQREKGNIHTQIQQMGLKGLIQFIGQVNNPLDYFIAGDVFAMVSREDPFPLVCLEAAAFGKPILCFADAGGMPEFVENDAGFIVPYLNLEAMAEKIVSLCADPSLLRCLGERAADKVRDRHDITAGTERISNIINGILKGCRY
ncbi:MAG: glycosyltransferase family 4 protein [Pedobacter sp.]